MAARDEPLIVKILTGLIGLIGVALGGGAAAATAELEALKQISLNEQRITRLSAAQAAIGRVKNIHTSIDLEGEANHEGFDSARFQALVDLTGNPPGPEALVAVWRRDGISDQELEKGIREGYIKEEWIPFYKSLRFLPLSVGEVVQATVQGHMEYGLAKVIAGQNGVDPADFDVLFQTAGNPPGPMETLTMLTRGIFTEAQAVQAIKESRLKDKYIPQFLQLARHRLPMRTINTLLTHGALSKDSARAKLKELGFSEEDVTALLASATVAKAAPHHQLAAGSIKALYVDRLITRDTAIKDLALAGYDADTAAALLQLADAQALHKIQAAAVTKVRSIYVGHRMTETQAKADLVTLGVPGDQIEPTLQLWNLERDANVTELTEAQLRLMTKKGLISPADYVARLVGHGYLPADAQLLMKAHDLDAPAKP